MKIAVRAGALAALTTLAACGSQGAASPKPTPSATASHQAVVVATLPTGPSNKHLKLPTANPNVTPQALPTVKPAPTFTPIPPSAYTAVIYGTVVDRKTNSPVPGALVTVGTGQRSARTSAYGAYRFSFPSGVAVPVTVSAQGFAGALAMGTLRPHQKLRLDFKLMRVVPGKVTIPSPPTVFGHP